MKKTFKTAPLPFQGQKRRFITDFHLAMSQLKEKKDIRIIVDLFGGSGLLAHTAKRIFPKARVIYNDHDHYSTRLHNIDKTNRLLSDLRTILSIYSRNSKIDSDGRLLVLERVKIDELNGYVDYITLSASLLFSAKYVISFAGLEKETLYNNVRVTDYDCSVDEYLNDLDVVHCDYRELYEKYKNVPRVLFLVDPPYLSTDTSTYHSDKYWKLRDYLDVLNVLVDTNYVFFTSDKSSLVELCEWFENNKNIGNPFRDSVLNTQNVTLNKTSSYTDMMLYKFVKE